MARPSLDTTALGTQVDARDILSRAFSRIAGNPPRAGNDVTLLKDAHENYPAWLDAIGRARRTIHFENYIIADDTVGRRFAAALAERARAGVTVRVLYDWFGSHSTPSAYWSALRQAGVEVRTFNSLRILTPLDAIHRNHRKVLIVDGARAFVSGLCVAKAWEGIPEKKLGPWRDTGVALAGPVVADVERAFAESWGLSGPPLSEDALTPPEALRPAGDLPARVIVTEPGQYSIYRLDQLVAAGASRTLWLTDAYYIATNAYVRALTDAARDGVDVRLLVPGASDVPAVQTVTRAGYRALLDAGVRVYEWNGTMLHAKTAVADGIWVRVGSSNLNLTSWAGNYELDVVVEDARFAAQMEAMYLADLANATEIVLDARRRVRSREAAEREAADGRRPRLGRRRGDGAAESAQRRRGGRQRLTASAVGLGSAAGAAISNVRPLAATEAKVIATIAAVMLAAAILFALFPLLLVVPVIALLVYFAAGLFWRSWRLRRERRAREARETSPEG